MEQKRKEWCKEVGYELGDLRSFESALVHGFSSTVTVTANRNIGFILDTWVAVDYRAKNDTI